MNVLRPMSKAANHTGVRRRLARTTERLQTLDNRSLHRMSRAKGSPMVVSLDGAHIRAGSRLRGAPFRGDGRAGGD